MSKISNDKRKNLHIAIVEITGETTKMLIKIIDGREIERIIKEELKQNQNLDCAVKVTYLHCLKGEPKHKKVSVCNF